jgi:hypothetical protein
MRKFLPEGRHTCGVIGGQGLEARDQEFKAGKEDGQIPQDFVGLYPESIRKS